MFKKKLPPNHFHLTWSQFGTSVCCKCGSKPHMSISWRVFIIFVINNTLTTYSILFGIHISPGYCWDYYIHHAYWVNTYYVLLILFYQPQGWSRCAAGPGAGEPGSFLETLVHVQPLLNLWASRFQKKNLNFFLDFSKKKKIQKNSQNLKNQN